MNDINKSLSIDHKFFASSEDGAQIHSNQSNYNRCDSNKDNQQTADRKLDGRLSLIVNWKIVLIFFHSLVGSLVI